ncbi:DUF4255 domain-containing protein [Shewanella sp. VB17]|nr:DUF4255 domain-containing protein [Shewanella sp. VB17]
MILSCVSYIANKLNQHLKFKFELAEDIVIVSNLVGHDGSLSSNINNRVVLFLINIEKETAVKVSVPPLINSNGLSNVKPIFLNLYLMVVANFTDNNYNESLKFMSSVISYFQLEPVFNHQNSPDLDQNIEKIILDIENIERHEQSNVWSMLGAKYMPSILYKIRMVTIDPKATVSRISQLSEAEVSTGTKE